MIERRPSPIRTINKNREFTREDAIRSVGVPVVDHFEKATNPGNGFFKRVKHFVKGESKLGRYAGLVTDAAMFFLPGGVRNGREAVQKIINKKDKQMPILRDKPWYKSKTIWSALILVITGVLQALGVDLAANIALTEMVYQVIYTVAGGFGLYGLRDAIAEKSDKIQTENAKS